ncbi:MAG: hypothetical protein GF313_07575, partial [Caldithrix sp.]|nr:hypothetical protein [Caldithrix sp.]
MNNPGKVDRVILTIVIVLMVGGLLMVFSASSMISNIKYQSLTHFFFRQIFWAVLTLTMIVVMASYDYKKINKSGKPFLLILLTIIL